MHKPQLLRQWSTDDASPGAELDYWVGAICEAFLEMDCDSRDSAHFAGRLRNTDVETLSLNAVCASTQDVYRSRRAIAHSRQQPFYLITQHRSPWHVVTAGRSHALRPGDAVLVDASAPYALHFPDKVDCLSIQLPRPWVTRWLVTVDSADARIAKRDAGWGRALSACMAQLGSDLASAHDLPATLLSDHLGALLSAALEPPASRRDALTDARYTRLRQCLGSMFDQHGLQAQDLAREMQMSVRSLHRCLAARGESFAQMLRSLRLTQARQMLQARHLAQLGIAEIGRRCGYVDASHFARDYQRVFGHTPRRARHMAVGVDQTGTERRLPPPDCR